jgi:hypothetical protein
LINHALQIEIALCAAWVSAGFSSGFLPCRIVGIPDNWVRGGKRPAALLLSLSEESGFVAAAAGIIEILILMFRCCAFHFTKSSFGVRFMHARHL